MCMALAGEGITASVELDLPTLLASLSDVTLIAHHRPSFFFFCSLNLARILVREACISGRASTSTAWRCRCILSWICFGARLRTALAIGPLHWLGLGPSRCATIWLGRFHLHTDFITSANNNHIKSNRLRNLCLFAHDCLFCLFGRRVRCDHPCILDLIDPRGQNCFAARSQWARANFVRKSHSHIFVPNIVAQENSSLPTNRRYCDVCHRYHPAVEYSDYERSSVCSTWQ